jgi:hypothetical protein
MSDEETKLVHIIISMCYECPYMNDDYDFTYCIHAWNDDETGKTERDFKIDDITKIAEFCRLEKYEKLQRLQSISDVHLV